jgi:hypothetical protein
MQRVKAGLTPSAKRWLKRLLGLRDVQPSIVYEEPLHAQVRD